MASKKSECIFCKIALKEIPAEIIYENNSFISFPDVNPKVEGHTLIIPKKHFETCIDIPSSLGEELLDAIKNTAEIRIKQGADGFNILQNNGKAAGQIVMHAHFHLLPIRNGGRKINLPF
ncbi:MAG: HIT domain-containing protein [Candidatus Pacearchaeota archaeon]